MIKIFTLCTLFLGTLFADTTILLHKGWQFIGFPSTIEKMQVFHNAHVDILWGYDGASKRWLGYAPDSSTQAKINKRYAPLNKIAPWQGVWIHNKSDWSLTLQDDNSQANEIALAKGWNLISLPNDMTVSPTLFQDDIIWRYHDKRWQLFSSTATKDSNTPPISKIASAEAFWVKSESTHKISLEKASSTLHTFNSKQDMLDYIQEMALDANIPRYYEVKDIAILEGGVVNAPVAADKQATDATSTNLQEDDVDESDILKHDGEHIFFYDRAKNIIHITNFSNLTQAQNSTIAAITLPKDTFIEAMFLHDNKLIMISNQQRYYYAQKMDIAIEPFMPNKTDDNDFQLILYDVSDINHIQKISTTTIDGNYQNSRIIGDKLYLISQFSPHLSIEYPHIYTDKKLCQTQTSPIFDSEGGDYHNICTYLFQDKKGSYRNDYSKPIIKDATLIPTINHGEKELITYDKLYAPNRLDQIPTITTISKFDITNNQHESSRALVGNTNKLYASSKNLYLTSVSYPRYYDFRHFQERETIYKFSLGEDFDYQAKGAIDGVMLSQFSMSEKDDILRVASTTGNGWRGDTNNFIYTLRQKEDTLQIEGELAGLGHQGERIQGVRFLGDRGYLVTFRQKDPFYTLDLSDPTNPRQVGELSVPGFSSYIHPVDENYILTLGRDASSQGRVAGFKVALYNISDFAHPTKADERIYSSSLYNFDAEYNHQAFIYRKSDKRFAITYHDEKTSHMDLFLIEAGHINSSDRLSVETNAYESRGIIFDINSHIYSTLFSGEAIKTKDLGAVQ